MVPQNGLISKPTNQITGSQKMKDCLKLTANTNLKLPILSKCTSCLLPACKTPLDVIISEPDSLYKHLPALISPPTHQ